MKKLFLLFLLLAFPLLQVLAQSFSGQSAGDIRVVSPYKFCVGPDNGTDVCLSQSASGQMKVNGGLNLSSTNTGNLALKNVVGDAVLYVTSQGSDSNDGLSWGAAKATVSAAIAALPASGGTVLLGAGNISTPLDGAGTECILANKPVVIRGAGQTPSILQVSTGIGSTIPVFRIQASSSAGGPFVFEHFQIRSAGATTAGDVFYVDGSVNPSIGVGQLFITDVSVRLNAFNGRSINAVGTGSTNFFDWRIQDNAFQNGILFNNLNGGDSILIEHNVLQGANACVEWSSGGVQNVIAYNNCTQTGGFLILHSSGQIKVFANEVGPPTACTEANSALIDLWGDVSGIGAAHIYDNLLNGGNQCTHIIRVANGANNQIGPDNEIGNFTGASADGINVAAAATDTRIESNLFFGVAGGALPIRDAGTRTQLAMQDSSSGQAMYAIRQPDNSHAAMTVQRNGPSGSVTADLVDYLDDTGANLAKVGKGGNWSGPELDTSLLFSLSANPATSGFGRLANGDAFNWRNNANSGNLNGISFNSSDQAVVGDAKGAVFQGPAKLPVGAFSALAACAAGTEGQTAAVTDSTTNTWGATITGSGTNHVLAYCDGTNWTVAAK